MYKERFQIYAAAYLILTKDSKVFLLRRANSDWMSSFYNLPAGHIEPGEKASIAAAREAQEEAGVRVEQKDLEIVHTMYRYSHNGGGESARVYADFFFTTQTWQGQPHLAEPERSDKSEWFPLDDLPENIIPYLKQALHNYQKGVFYSEFGWD